MIYLAPFGFDTRHVVSSIVEHGISDDDRVVIVAPETNKGDERFESSREKVRQLLADVGDAAFETLFVDHIDFRSTTLEIASFIAEQEDDIFLNASNGAREILLATIFAGMFQREHIAGFDIYSDVDETNIGAELPFPVSVNEDEQQLLRAVSEDITLQELADTLGLEYSTASRRVKRLEEKQLLETEKQGRTKQIRLSFTGELCRITRSI